MRLEWQYSKRVRIAQSSALPTIADEPASPVRDDSEGEDCLTESRFIADQDRATIAKSSTLPHDSAPRVTSPAADEGSMQQTIFELTTLCTSLERQHSKLLAKFQAQEVDILRLKERVQVLEDRESVAAKQSRDDAPIKGRSINEGEAAAERIIKNERNCIEPSVNLCQDAGFLWERVGKVLGSSWSGGGVVRSGEDIPNGCQSAFLYGTIDEEVYVMQPSGFQDPEFLYRVYKVEKAMYGLHQALRAWYGTLSKYLLDNGFQRRTIDQTQFIRKYKGEFLLVQVYINIFGSSNPKLCREFEALMHDKFQMSPMGELNFFLGLQVLQKKDGIFLLQDKYVGDILKKFRYTDIRFMIASLMYLTASRLDIMFTVCACARHQVTPKKCHLYVVKRIFRYLKGHSKLELWYPKESPFDLVAYSDNDYGGANQDRKSTTRDDNVADLLPKAFDVGRFQYLVGGDSGNFANGLNKDPVVNMYLNFLHGSDSEQ
uniref:Reverse transcriptase Ty1/copia-type domain-containing protein n=1 Tax=Tanacetum cinerariifolium TaxID=118510 RepID=A0A6L2KE04_TANCI|nr:hypothetical protein [Tanacetum cinerariifolium]